MKKLLFTTLILIFVSSCNKSDKLTDGIVVDRAMDISFIDANGEDLLNQENPNAFNKNDIFLYHQINGEKTLYNAGPQADYPNGTIYYCERPLCAIRIFLSDTSYLELSDQITDTIYAEIVSVPGNISVRKIWYNGEFLWNIENDGEKYFTIVK